MRPVVELHVSSPCRARAFDVLLLACSTNLRVMRGDAAHKANDVVSGVRRADEQGQ